MFGAEMNVKIKRQGAIDDVLDIFQEISADSHHDDNCEHDEKMNDRHAQVQRQNDPNYHRMPSRRPRAASLAGIRKSNQQRNNVYKYDKAMKQKQLARIPSDKHMEIVDVGKMPIHPVGHILGDHTVKKQRPRSNSDSWK